MTATLQPESRSPSRRALLAGALGGIGAWAASAIGRASPVRAENENIQIGHEYDTAQSLTRLTNTLNNDSVFTASSDGGGNAITGVSSSGFGVSAGSFSAAAVFGSSTSGSGLYGQSGSSYGVYGESGASVGVYGKSHTWYGVYGESDSSVGVYAQSTTSTGVIGTSAATSGIGVYGTTSGGGTASRGVVGNTASGHGIHGVATSGWAGYFAGRVFTTKYHEMQEISAPTAPAANHARLFVRDNGGKTQLCVRFNTGGVLVIKTQP